MIKHEKGLSNVREQQLDYEMSTFFRQEWYDNRLAYGSGQTLKDKTEKNSYFFYFKNAMLSFSMFDP